MTGNEADECVAIVERIGPVILSTVPAARKGANASELRHAVGAMVAHAGDLLASHGFSEAMRSCLDQARIAGASLTSMGQVRLAAESESPISLPATLTVLCIIRLCLAQEARIVAGMVFTSRDDASNTATEMSSAFSDAAEVASDDLDAGSYMAIINLQATVVKRLADVGRTLPRVINYSFAGVMPALTMAQRAYADADRTQELIDENKVVHPAFMPMTGRMLAV
ncbi:hypothetical protein [Bradyrhizobium japonicum]|uniref:hypothetical protein n=1 Tax=Bradyrhizobium japonicum TaxID=375 RepID=UPI00209E0EEB|nr:hypothetical protein [Bradyrhizobium japonicum]MCP1761943.1 prophage DNA circulation protein [Bradyrhizobium japonicum]MCP1793523.1 prophage DNA circulation protein [Bradyrhizobium japonicum]MCP1805956.1 prophage DNA circulation protein [Bradyrhizobium japonicum]MCP1812359.1 prophage DNA circulation protein [Bradyrhizobium japonicum]MCP1873598.1 prophage DNA circulation protein [Bradyrhizobium japonicum]